jgi:hypothetical protein
MSTMTEALKWFELVDGYVADGSDPDVFYTVRRSAFTDEGWAVSRHVGRLPVPWRQELPPTLPPSGMTSDVSTVDEAKLIAEQWENSAEH